MSPRFSNFIPDTLAAPHQGLLAIKALKPQPVSHSTAVRSIFDAVDPSKAPTLFDDQHETLTGLRRSVATGHRRPMVWSATGSGKTVMSVSLTRDAIAKWLKEDFSTRLPHAVIFIVPKKDLVPQTAKRFREGGINDIGLLGGGYKQNLTAPVIITTWQSLKNRPELMKTKIVLIDEAHVLPEFLRKWMTDDKERKILFVGLSATPGTPSLGKYFDDLVVGGMVGDLTEKGRLSPFRIFYPKPDKRPDMKGVKTVAGEWHEGQAAERMSKKELIADVLQIWLEKGENRPTVCFATTRVHAKELRNVFDAAGVSTGYIDMHTENDERDEIAEKSKSGEIQVVFNVNCLVAGTDWPWISCGILAKPVKKGWTYVQMIGRFLRTFEGKTDALIFDHSMSTADFIENGDVTDIYKLDFDFSLDDGKSKKASKSGVKKCVRCKEPLEKGERKCQSCGYEPTAPNASECLRCGYLKPAGVHKCPCCKHEPLPPSGVDYLPGELTEAVSVRGSKSKAPTKAEKQAWFGQLLFIAAERRFQKPEGWAAHKYQERFGVWPRGLDDIPQIPTGEVRNWVKSRQIAWAKARRV